MNPKYKIDDKVKLINGDDFIYTVEAISQRSSFFYDIRQNEETLIKNVPEYQIEEA